MNVIIVFKQYLAEDNIAPNSPSMTPKSALLWKK